MVMKIMGEVLAVLAHATKQVKQGRLSSWAHRLQNVLTERIPETFAKETVTSRLFYKDWTDLPRRKLG
jgi:hypothetical protein